MVLLSASCKKNTGESSDYNEVVFVEDSLQVPSEGGKFSVLYDVLVSVEGAGVSAVCGAEWINGLAVSDTAVHFIVSPFDGKEPRSASIVLRYVYGGTVLSDEVMVEQDGLGYDVRVEALDYNGLYQVSADTLYAEVYFSDDVFSSPGSTAVWLKIPMQDNEENSRGLSEGTYTVGQDGSLGTISDALYYTINSTADDFESLTVLEKGTLTVKSDNGVYLFEGSFTGEDGLVYNVTYRGNGGLMDLDAKSTLRSDMEADLSDHEKCRATFYGMMSRAYGWEIVVAADDGYCDMFEFTLYTEESTVETGIPDGVYVASTDRTAGTFYQGTWAGSLTTGSWYTHYARYGSCDAPVVDGTVSVKNNADGTVSLTFDCVDDARYPHRITGEWTGVPDYAEDILVL